MFSTVELESTESHKHWGLVLSCDLSWSNHIDSILQTISTIVDVLIKLKHDLDGKSLQTTYFSFIRPRLEYGCHIWDSCSRRVSNLLENLQLDMARVVTGAEKGQVMSCSIMKQIGKHFQKEENYLHQIIWNHYSPAQIGAVKPNSNFLITLFM